MTKVMPEACHKCGGFSQFYHNPGNPNFGYVKCEKCGHRQKSSRTRDEAVLAWNKKNNFAGADRRIWDNYEVIAEIRKSDAIKFVVAAATRQGFRYINIREFYLRKGNMTWVAGRDGITIPLVAPLNKGEQFINPIVDMLKALSDARDFASTMELMNEEKAIWIKAKEKK